MGTSLGGLLTDAAQAVPVQPFFERENHANGNNCYKCKSPREKGERRRQLQAESEKRGQYDDG